MRKTVLLTLIAAAFYFHSLTSSPAVNSARTTTPKYSPMMKTGSMASSSTLTRGNFEDVIKSLYETIGLPSYNLSYDVFRLAMIGYFGLEKEGALSDQGLITIINFEQPSTEKRFYTIDIVNREVKYHTYVAHGRNTGNNLATKFSNIPHSNQSSLGFFVTGETYVGSKGYSLRLDGMEKSINDKVRSRAVVIHAADYATPEWINRYGRLGRSQGCPALPPHLNKEVINTIKNKTAIFTYYPDSHYLNTSRYLQLEKLLNKLDEHPIELAASAVLKQL